CPPCSSSSCSSGRAASSARRSSRRSDVADEVTSSVEPQPEATGPRIGRDEWVARAGELGQPRTVLAQLRNQVNRVPQVVLLIAFTTVVALIPVMSSSQYIVRVAADTMLYVLLAAGLNVAVGWAGLLDLGYVAFY